MIFQLLEINEKIIIIIMKKKSVQKIELGYCPDYIVRRENCITIQVLYCDWECKARGLLYCNEIFVL